MANKLFRGTLAAFSTLALLCSTAAAARMMAPSESGDAFQLAGDLGGVHADLDAMVRRSVQDWQSRGAWGIPAAGPSADASAVSGGAVGAPAGSVQTQASISPEILARLKAQPPMVVRAGMAIDNDGVIADAKARSVAKRDPCHQNETSYRYKGGKSLDPAAVPFIVAPRKYKKLLGDLAVVEYNGKRVTAMVGDIGPRFGEGSVALAEALGINSDGVKGGVEKGVTYTIYPGSKPGPMMDQGQLMQAMTASAPTLIADASSRQAKSR